MQKKDFCEEVILQFSEFIFWNYNSIRIFDHGPEFGVEFYSGSLNRKITIVWDDSDTLWITFQRNNTSFFKLIQDTDPRIYFSINLLYKDNTDYKKIQKLLNEKNYSEVVKENIFFIKNNLFEIIKGEKWI